MSKSLFRNGLTARNTFLNRLLLSLNSLYRPPVPTPLPKNPKGILICNIANLGDLLISSTVIPAIKKNFPHSPIGLLTSTRSKVALHSHPDISRIHIFDHVYLTRKELGLCKAALQHRRTERKAIREIAPNYDLAIDLQLFFPNTIPLLYKAKIPFRLGYTAGGFGNLLTHPHTSIDTDSYLCHSHLSLLASAGFKTEEIIPLPNYPPRPRPSILDNNSEYICVNIGTSQTTKEWEVAYWIELVQLLCAENWSVVLTGKGMRDRVMCKQITEMADCINLSDLLSWEEFVGTVQNASLLISVDTAATHIAASANRPAIVIHTGINNPKTWIGGNAIPMTYPTPCAPCFQKNGCKTMDCIRKVTPKEVFRRALSLINREPS